MKTYKITILEIIIIVLCSMNIGMCIGFFILK